MSQQLLWEKPQPPKPPKPDWKSECLLAVCRVFGVPKQIWNNGVEIKP